MNEEIFGITMKEKQLKVNGKMRTDFLLALLAFFISNTIFQISLSVA